MLETTISNIEKKIRDNTVISSVDKDQLLDLLSTLKTEIGNLSVENSEHAESIAGFTQTSTHEAIRKEKNEHLLSLSLKGLTSSVEEFETTRPALVQIVNRIAHVLSNMGI